MTIKCGNVIPKEYQNYTKEESSTWFCSICTQIRHSLDNGTGHPNSLDFKELPYELKRTYGLEISHKQKWSV